MHGSLVSEERIRAAAEQLAGAPVRALVPATSGANSRIFRLETRDGVFALKSYPARANDKRNRADVEWRTLQFLTQRGVATVPKPLARDADGQFLLMEWIDGALLTAHQPADVEEAAAFIAKIFSLSSDPEAGQFPLASEACLSRHEIVRQLEERLAWLDADGAVGPFLADTFRPALSRATEQAGVATSDEALLPDPLRRLIPADFGFHNVVRQGDGRLRYIDFEYFGWDDPAKVTADFIVHPAMELSADDRRAFVAGIVPSVPADSGFVVRLRRDLPLYALRWALILFNPFRRDRADELPGEPQQRAALLASRTGKARTVLARASESVSALPF